MPAPNPQKRQPRDHQELPRNNIDSNCSKDLQPDAPKQIKTQTRPSLEKKPKRVPHKPINLRTKTHHQMYLGGHKSKNLSAALLFIEFSKAFDSIHRGKMKEILSVYGITKETVDAIMIL